MVEDALTFRPPEAQLNISMVLFNSRLFVVLIRPAGVTSVVEPLVPRFMVVQDGRVNSIAASLNHPEPHYR